MNPYKKHTMSHEVWNEGYVAAMKDSQDKVTYMRQGLALTSSGKHVRRKLVELYEIFTEMLNNHTEV